MYSLIALLKFNVPFLIFNFFFKKIKTPLNLGEYSYLGQQRLGLAGKVRSLRLTSPGSIPAASGLLLVGILGEGNSLTRTGQNGLSLTPARRLAQGQNTTIKAPIFFLTKKKRVFLPRTFNKEKKKAKNKRKKAQRCVLSNKMKTIMSQTMSFC